jgi:predicted nuclease of restriction endonuclease-like (RecB) superfamily
VLTTVAKKIQEWTARNGGVIDAEALNTIRKEAVNEAIAAKLGTNADPKASARYAASLLGEVRPLIDDAIEKAGGTGWRNYLKTHEIGAQEINIQKLYGEAADMYRTNKQGFIDLIKGNNPDAVEKIFGPGSFNILEEALKNERGEYGKQIVGTVARQLEIKYGRNFTEKNVRRMIRFAQEFPDCNILPPLAAKLSWSHFIELFSLKSKEAKFYYAQNCIEQNWGKRELRNQIQRKAYERTEIANIQFSNSQPDLMNTFKDPYVLDFLNLKNTYLEHDLEKTILQELETFVLELGKGFAFMERQKRMIIDGDDFYLDLLF